MITPRSTRLVRVSNLQAFREAVVALTTAGSPADARDRLVVVPTRAAGMQLLRTIEDTLLGKDGAIILPDIVTAGELVTALAGRLEWGRPPLTDAEREVVLGLACRAVRDAGVEPPFRLRPGLIGEALRFYDALRRQQRDVDTFERLALGALEPGASYDRGAERLVRQTRFLVAAYRDFEARCVSAGDDEHALRVRLLTERSARPCRDVVLTVTDRAFDRQGLWPADWDLLTRVPGLQQLTLVVTDTVLAGALHERLHDVLPGIEEVRFVETEPALPPRIVVSGDRRVHEARDREEEVALFARRVRHAVRQRPEVPLDAHAIVVCQPLPYGYVAREVLRSAGVPSQAFAALPLAGEPYAAALDLVLAAVAGNFARAPVVALLKSPQFSFDVAALDRVLPQTVAELTPLLEPAPAATQLDVLLAFMRRHERLPAAADPLGARHRRARGGVIAALASFRDAYARFDAAPMPFDELAALIRRGIEVRTFAPRRGDGGVHIIDAEAARFGRFDHVHLAGLVDGEWPETPRRDIFYSPSVLRDLGWPAESHRIDAARAAFTDLLHLPASRLVVSTFSLDADALVTPSPLVEMLGLTPLEPIDEPLPAARVFEHERLGIEPIATEGLTADVRASAMRRLAAPPPEDARFHGATGAHTPAGFSLSALERYQDCGFKFFAADVLRLEEPAEDESTFSPRARGRFIHEVFQRFFEAWDGRRSGTMTPERMAGARALFGEVAEPLLAALPEAEAALERTRLFGSAISVGIVDVVLAIEASRPVDVRERWLEYRLEGAFALSPESSERPGGRRVPLRGVADRIDLLEGRRLRVIDYKSGAAPNTSRALQVPIYALCAQERLMARDSAPWAVDEAAYVAFGGRKALAHVVKPGDRGPAPALKAAETLAEARDRVFDLVDGIGRGEFAPRPHDPMMCRYCAYAAVCRKDYVDD